MIFEDRYHAGHLLAEALKPLFKDSNDGVVFGLPRGGVVVGFAVAEKLKMPLSMILVRKIGHPNDPEYAIGAVSEHAEVFNEDEIKGVNQGWLKQQVQSQRDVIRHRKKIYAISDLSVANKIAVVVDDGLATGLTMKVAVQELRRKNPVSIIAAVPVAAEDSVAGLWPEVNNVIALYSWHFFGVVGSYYNRFPQVSDNEIIELIKKVKLPRTDQF